MLIVTKHYSTGMVEVEHRQGGSLIAVYSGYLTREGLYKLYPKRVLYGDARYAGKIIGLREMQIDLQERPAKAETPPAAKKNLDYEAPGKPAGRQLSFFDKIYNT